MPPRRRRFLSSYRAVLIEQNRHSFPSPHLLSADVRARARAKANERKAASVVFIVFPGLN
jgi:hypothetical protein